MIPEEITITLTYQEFHALHEALLHVGSVYKNPVTKALLLRVQALMTSHLPSEENE